MLYVLCGPSGSGKTTFLKLLTSKFDNLKVVPVYVFRNTLRSEVEIGKIENDKAELVKFKSNFDYILNYNEDIYAFKIPLKEELNGVSYIIDYPGEYPKCTEFQHIIWKGILILPLNEVQLINRLKKCNRQNRITSSTEEYKECIKEIDQNVYNNLQWRVIVNDSFLDLKKCIEEIETVANIV